MKKDLVQTLEGEMLEVRLQLMLPNTFLALATLGIKLV